METIFNRKFKIYNLFTPFTFWKENKKRTLFIIALFFGLFQYAFPQTPLFSNFTNKLPGMDNWGATSAAWSDFDGDGLLDLFVFSNYQSQYLYKQTSLGNFTDVSSQAGVKSIFWGTSPTWADLDKNTLPELLLISRVDEYTATHDFNNPVKTLVFNNPSGNSLVRTSGVWERVGNGETIVPGDFDGDGDVDFIAFYSHYGQSYTDGVFLYENRGGTFFLADSTGLFFQRNIEGAQCLDFNNDGMLDLFFDGVFFINKGGLKFEPWYGSGIAQTDDEGVAFADFDNDGDFDFITNANIHPGIFPGEFNTRIYRNEGGLFTDITSTINIQDSLLAGHWHAGTMDYDNDGKMDFFVGSNLSSGNWLLFHNDGNFNFTEVTDSVGLPKDIYHSGASFGDYDLDGDEDFFVCTSQRYLPKFFENGTNTLNFLPVRASTENGSLSCFGATIRLFPAGNTNDTILIRFVGDGQGYSTKDSYDKLLAIDPNSQYDLEIIFPSSQGRMLKVDKTVNSKLGNLRPSDYGNSYTSRLFDVRRDGSVKINGTLYNPESRSIPVLTLTDNSVVNFVNGTQLLELNVFNQNCVASNLVNLEIDTVDRFTSPVYFQYTDLLLTGNFKLSVPILQSGKRYFARINIGDTSLHFPFSEFKSFRINTPPSFSIAPFDSVNNAHYEPSEDSIFTFKAVAHDADTLLHSDSLAFSILYKPNWLSYNSSSHLLTGIPSAADVGHSSFAVIVSDKYGGKDTATVVLHVLHTNHNPTFVGWNPDTTTIEDEMYAQAVSATDEDSALFGDYVRYRLMNKPSWLAIDSITGVSSGIPRVENLFDTIVTVQAYDNVGGTATQAYTLHIQHVNHIPEIVSTGSFTAKEDSLYSCQVKVEDPDTLVGDVLSYSLTKKPSWLSINSSGLISGTPLGKNVGDTLVTVRVSDGKGGIASQSYPITVSHTNHAPVILTQADTTAMEDSVYTYTVRATDQDSALFGDQVRYSFSIKPSWLTMDSTSGFISGTPSQLNARDTIVAIQAYDGKGGISTQQYSLLVQHVNHAPVFVSIPDTTAKEDSMYTYSVKVTDQDSILFGDKVYFALNNAPPFLSIDSVSGTVSGIPTLVDTVFALIKPKAHLPAFRVKGPRVIITKRNESVEAMPLKKIKPAGRFKIALPASESAGIDDVIRTFAMTVKAYDDKGGVSLQAFDLHVEHTNHPPVFTSLPVSVATEDSFYSYHVSGFDVDTKEFGDSVVIQPVIIPSWMQFDPVSNTLSGTPQGKYAVDTTVRLQMEDQKGKSALQEFQLDMINTNHPPAIVSTADSSVAEDSLYIYALTVIDSDVEYGRDSLIVEVLSLPSWLTFTGDTVKGIPLYYNVGDTLVSLRVSDAKGSMDSMQWVITVTPTYHLPENFGLISTIPKDTLNIDRSKDLVFTWNPSHDADIEDTLFYSFHIWGNSLDTTILNLKDTSLSTQLMKYFTVSTPYRWTVGVTDKRFIVPSHDTIMFVTSDKILNVDDWKSKIPTDFIVYQNYPNPFNPSTTIRFGVPVTSKVLIEIYNIIGQRVTMLTNQEFDARYYEVRWNAANVSSGVYFAVVRMKPLNEPATARQFIKKLLMLK